MPSRGDAGHPRWRPQDFIISGTHCPISTIRGQLAALRAKAGAEWLLLLVYQQEPHHIEPKNGGRPTIVPKEKFFQSLALFAHTNSDIESLIDREGVVNRLQAGRMVPLREGKVESAAARLLLSSNSWELLTKNGSLTLEARWISAPMPESNPKNGLIQFHTRACLLAPLGDPEISITQSLGPDDYEIILAMIHASVPVVVHRNMGRIKTAELVTSFYEASFGVDALVAASTSSADYPRYVEQFADSILSAALELTGSSIGNLYLSTAEKGTLVLVSEVNNARAIKKLSLDARNTVVGFVYKNAKPLLINDFVEFRQSHPDVEYKWVGDSSGKEPFAELAVPIISPNPESTTQHILGVLNVEKVRPEDSGLYSDHDLGLLRFLALRFCIWRKSLAAAMANRSLLQILPLAPIDVRARIEKQHSATIDPRVPLDFHFLHPHLLDLLSQAYYLTRSKAASIRLLSTDGTRLVRFCACPEAAMIDLHPAIALSRKDSVNAYVGRSGEQCDLPQISDHRTYKKYHGLNTSLRSRAKISSEYCLPLILRGKLVGTINLESEYIDAFSGEKHFLHAIRAQVELALYSAQSYYEQSVLSVSARASLNTHELLKCIGDLSRLLPQASPGLAAALGSVLGRLLSCTADAQTSIYNPDSSSSTSYRDIIESLIVMKGIDHVISWESVDSVVDCRLRQELAPTIMLVLNEVLENSFIQATQVPGGTIRVSIRPETQAGNAFDVIYISHEVSTPLEDNAVARLYRVPIKKADRLHIGAFLAGAITRSLGGDITFSYHAKYKSARTAIHIPALPQYRVEGDSK